MLVGEAGKGGRRVQLHLSRHAPWATLILDALATLKADTAFT